MIAYHSIRIAVLGNVWCFCLRENSGKAGLEDWGGVSNCTVDLNVSIEMRHWISRNICSLDVNHCEGGIHFDDGDGV